MEDEEGPKLQLEAIDVEHMVRWKHGLHREAHKNLLDYALFEYGVKVTENPQLVKDIMDFVQFDNKDKEYVDNFMQRWNTQV